MGKVKDGSLAISSAKPAKVGSSSNAKKKGWLFNFVANLASARIYKPLQGKWARLYTGLALALIIVLGLYQLFEHLSAYSILTRAGVVTAIGVVLGWITFRILQYPPFVEFLIATEAEMNKVSWTSREDLKRATIVVLVTVLVMTVYLFGVDFLCSSLLKLMRVIQINDTSSLGTGG